MRPSSALFRLLFSSAGLAAALLSVPGTGHAAAPADPSGTWLTEDGRGRIRIEHCLVHPEAICGYVVWMKEPDDANGKPRKDSENPDHAKQSRLVLGHQLVLGLQPDAEGRFEGQIYNADNGKKYAVTLWRASEEELKLRGCMLAVLCGSQTWTPTTTPAPGQLTAATGAPGGPRPDAEWAPDATAKHATPPKPVK